MLLVYTHRQNRLFVSVLCFLCEEKARIATSTSQCRVANCRESLRKNHSKSLNAKDYAYGSVARCFSP